MDDDYLRGIANQDQELAEIASTFGQTDSDMKEEFVALLEIDYLPDLRHEMQQLPDEWLAFFQKCCLAGLRQAILDRQ